MIIVILIFYFEPCIFKYISSIYYKKNHEKTIEVKWSDCNVFFLKICYTEPITTMNISTIWCYVLTCKENNVSHIKKYFRNKKRNFLWNVKNKSQSIISVKCFFFFFSGTIYKFFLLFVSYFFRLLLFFFCLMFQIKEIHILLNKCFF